MAAGSATRQASLNLLNDTLAGNIAPGTSGGGINNQGNTLIQNTIFSANSGNNCSTINNMDQGNNIDSGTTCGFTASTSLSNANPQLGQLQITGDQPRRWQSHPTAPPLQRQTVSDAISNPLPE